MYCPKCGKELREGEVCGCENPQNFNPPPQNPGQEPPLNEYPGQEPPQAPYYQEPQPPYGRPYNPYAAPATPVIDILRRRGSSSLMLALVILLGAGCLFSFLRLVTGADFSGGYSAYSLGYNFGVSLGSMLVSIPGIVMFIGALKLYLDCRSPKTPFVPSGGLTVIQVMAIISVSFFGVLILIYAVILGFAGTFAASALWDYMDSLPAGLAGMALSVVYVVLFLVVAVMALYYISFLCTVSALKNNARTGTPAKKVSMLFIVMLYIMGGFTALGGIGSFDEPLEAITMLISAAACIVGGVVLTQYRKEINLLVRGY